MRCAKHIVICIDLAQLNDLASMRLEEAYGQAMQAEFK